jgi:hypothetical protein
MRTLSGSCNSHKDLGVLRLDSRQTELWCLVSYESVPGKRARCFQVGEYRSWLL